MRYSKLCTKTRLQAPHDSNSVNARYLIQGGFIDQTAAGIYSFLPLGQRVLHKINRIIREEMDAVEGQEITMPILHPIDLWNTTGRSKTMDEILFRTKGVGDRDFLLGPSHEETVTPLVKKFVNSYKDLPLSVYQIRDKFRNEPRAKSGILRGREFGMKDMYSFHATEADLDQYYEKVKEGYLKVYTRCGLKAYVVEASGGAFSDKLSHEFAILTPAGEDTILLNQDETFAQNLEVATGKVPLPGKEEEKELPMEKKTVERKNSIKANAEAHNAPEWKILKTVVYEVEETGLLGILIRGDLNVNEHKLERYLGKQIRPASLEKLESAGLTPGFISPVKNDKIPFIADHSIKSVKNFITGNNEPGVDLINVNIGTDFTVKDFVDLVEVKSGFLCPQTNTPLREEKAIEAGNIFKLGTIYSEAFDLKFTDSDGKEKPVIMGCYGIGNTRLMGTIVEACHDEKGIIWPISVAPYHIHLITLGKDESVKEAGDTLYEQLKKENVEVFFDDRNESAGKKFNDADLIGIPVRIVLSSRTLEKQSIEWKLRNEEEAEHVKLTDLSSKINTLLNK